MGDSQAMKKVIYYFSGTGNSLHAARLIADQLGDSKLISMRRPFCMERIEDAEMVGFVFPVYEFDAPQTVQDFIRELPVKSETYYFAIATYIAVHGKCFESIEAILKKKGACLSYARAVRYVASQCLVYPPFPPEKIMGPISERAIKFVAKEISLRKTKSCPHMSLLTKKLYPIVISPYMRLKPEYDTGFYVNEDCIHCGTCKRVCPCANIKLEGGKPAWLHHCESCNACGMTSAPS